MFRGPLVWAWVGLAGKLDHSLASLARTLSPSVTLTLARLIVACYHPYLASKKETSNGRPHPSPARPPVPHHDYPPKRRNCSSCHSAPHPLPSHQLLQTDKPSP